MKTTIKYGKNIEVRDISCTQCIRCRTLAGLYGCGYCTRLNMDCDAARNICEKSQWYVEMCTMSAILDSELK